jgi:hypothetical protein
MTTAADFLRDRHSLRPQTTLKRELLATRNERDMLARQLADLSRKHTDARVILTMALKALSPYRHYSTPRAAYNRIRSHFGLPEDEA